MGAETLSRNLVQSHEFLTRIRGSQGEHNVISRWWAKLSKMLPLPDPGLYKLKIPAARFIARPHTVPVNKPKIEVPRGTKLRQENPTRQRCVHVERPRNNGSHRSSMHSGPPPPTPHLPPLTNRPTFSDPFHPNFIEFHRVSPSFIFFFHKVSPNFIKFHQGPTDAGTARKRPMTAHRLHEIINANYRGGDMIVSLEDKTLRAEITLLTRLKIIARYLGQPDQGTQALIRCVKEVLVETGEIHQYAAIRHKEYILLDAKRIDTLCTRVLYTLNTPAEMDELKFLCSTPDGRRRTRLTGGGRRAYIPRKMAQMVYARLTYMTWIFGRFSNEDIKDAVRSYAPQFRLQVCSPGEEPEPIEGNNNTLMQ